MSTTNPVHPKVKAAGITMGILVVICAALAAITPQLLSFAGSWSVVIYAGVVGLGGYLAGYIKKG